VSGETPAGFDLDNLLRPQKRRTRHLWIIGIALYVGAVWFIGWRSIRDALATLDAASLAGMLGATFVAIWLRAVKWRFVLGGGQNAVGVYFLSKAAGGWSPGRVGELAPLLLKRYRTPRMAAWIAVDRLLEIAATLGLGLIGLVGFRAPEYALLVTICLALGALVVAPLYVLTRRGWYLRLAAHTREASMVHRLSMLLAAMSDEIRHLGKSMPLASALTILATSADIVVAMFLYHAFGFDVSFLLLAVVQCAHGLASAVPIIPNATGVPYLVAAGLLYRLAGVPEEVLVAAIAINMVTSNVAFWSSFGIGGAAPLWRGQDAAEMRGEDQAALFDRLAARGVLYVYTPESLVALNGIIEAKGRLLDVGCGDGAIGEALDADAVVATDISPQCVRLAAKRGLHGVVADATRGLPFADGTFDTVYCADVLHHLRDHWAAVFDHMDHALRPGGRLVIVEPDVHNPMVRWTQAPESPIRTAPCANEPALDVSELMPFLLGRGYACQCSSMFVRGEQVERATFPLWQRVLKAPFVMPLVWIYGRGRYPNKLVIVAQKREDKP